MLIYDLDLDSITNLLQEWDEPAYRAKQIWQGLYQHLYDSPEQFTNLSKSLREKLAKHVTFSPFKVKTYLDSSDGFTRKTLLELPDKNLIEAVLMKYGDPADNPQIKASAPNSENLRGAKNRRTLCISTQAGCAMGCVFCATGQMGFARHLTETEIFEQALFFARELEAEGERLSNIVLMGMGEPFHNYEASLGAIRRLMDDLGIGARHITVSTVGLVPQIRQFADEGLQVKLAISLHAATDEERAALLPINKRWKLDELIGACHYYVEKSGRRVTFEWSLIQGKNDTPEQAIALGKLLKDLHCHVNLIPLNPTAGYAGGPSAEARINQFVAILGDYGIPATVRVRRGIDINAGCGQLKASVLKKERKNPIVETTEE